MDVEIDEHGLVGYGSRWDKPRMFTGVKVFSATKAKEREELSENVNRWIKANADVEVVDRVVRQSSDNEFHCYSLTLFYKQRST